MTATTKRGRPPLDPGQRSVPVHVKFPPKQYDALYVDARRQAMSVPELIRRTLRDRNLKSTRG